MIIELIAYQYQWKYARRVVTWLTRWNFSIQDLKSQALYAL